MTVSSHTETFGLELAEILARCEDLLDLRVCMFVGYDKEGVLTIVSSEDADDLTIARVLRACRPEST